MKPSNKSKLNPVARAAMQGWKPQDLRFAWEWCEDWIVVDNTSPFPGKWRIATSPWVRDLMEVKTDRRATFIAVRCSAQSAKTQTVMNLLCYDISEDPGPTMYVMANGDDAKDFVRDRFHPTMKACKPARDALLREGKLSYTFTTMPLYFVGAGSSAKLQGKPIKRLYLDEVRNYPPGALETVLKRVRAFGALAQVFLVSTGNVKGDDVDRAFENGDQRTPHFPCPACGHIQQFRFAQIKWTTNETTKPEGKWNFDRMAETIRFECEKCSHPIKDTPTERKLLCRTARFIRMNPNAPGHHVSFTWGALLPWWVAWRSVVEEFILARQALRMGDIQPMKTFVTETLGESWEDHLGIIEDAGHLEARKDKYDFGEPWPEEVQRFMAADVQAAGGEHYWYAVRAFNKFGASRLMGFGRATSKDELEKLRQSYNVPITNAMIDTGYKASEIYRFCLATGWKAMKGDDTDYFLHRDLKTNRTVRRLWDRSFVDPYMGTRGQGKAKPLALFRFSTNGTKDLLAEFMRGLVGNWTMPEKVGKEYVKQITAERRVEHTDPRGRVKFVWQQVLRDNHLFDCELMITVAAVITRLIIPPAPAPKSEGEVTANELAKAVAPSPAP